MTVSKSLADAKLAYFQTSTSSSSTDLSFLEFNFFSVNSGLSPAAQFSLNDHKKAFYALKGFSVGSVKNVERQYFQSIVGNTALYPTYDDVALQFYLNFGFILSPTFQNNASSFAVDSTTITPPVGSAVGNVAILATIVGAGGTTTPAGWTVLQTISAQSQVAKVFSKILTLGDLSTTITVADNGHNGNVAVAAMYIYQGSSAVDVSNVGTTGDGSNGTTPTVTTTKVKDAILSIWCWLNNVGNGTITFPAAVGNRLSVGTSKENVIGSGDEIQASAGLSTARVATLGTATARAQANFTVAIKN